MIKSKSTVQALLMTKAAASRHSTAARNPERTKQKILEIALIEFASKGFSGTRTAMIAQQAKVNKQALYYHFGNKKQLYQNVLENGYSAIYQRIGDRLKGVELNTMPPIDAVRVLLEIYFDTVLEFQKVLELVEDENRHKGVHLKELTSIRTMAQAFFIAMKNALTRGAAEGVFQKDLDPVHTWMSMISLSQFWWTHRFTLSYILAKDITTPKMIRNRRSQIVEFIISALKPSI